ncbi:MAG: hypothetical protein A2Z98_12385 [Spirochaetes bacterium GWB1_27_13]|nr:MAG: hypothetical protein A2Z98_12385 [Spirochaetes bacterium GWB1_27_13]
MIVIKSFENIEKSLAVLPPSIIEKFKIGEYKQFFFENDIKNTKNLFFIFCSFFQFIAKEENIKIDENVLVDYTTLNIADYFSRIFYDGVFDHKESNKLPIANLCYTEYILLSDALSIDIRQAIAKTEPYYYCQNVLPIGKIDIDYAKKLNENWTDCTLGFATSLYTINHFVSKYIKNSFWSDFFYFYLLWRQILDDTTDFSEDYQNKELKSIGILALCEKFNKFKHINLKNPLTAINFQLYVLNNYNKIYADLIKRFEIELSTKMKVDDFYKTIEKIENFLPS